MTTMTPDHKKNQHITYNVRQHVSRDLIHEMNMFPKQKSFGNGPLVIQQKTTCSFIDIT